MPSRLSEDWDGRNRLYRVFRGMHERCEDPKHKSYDYYGGRGIFVCWEWDEFVPFEQWALSTGYEQGLKLDRRENDGPYAPWNCRWVTHEENCNNTRMNHKVTAWGETKSISRWERDGRCSVSKNTIFRRLRSGYRPEDAIQLPNGYELNGSGVATSRRIKAFGEEKTLAEWVRDERCVVVYSALVHRLDHGWLPEEAMTTASGTYTAKQKTAARLTAFGETKLISEWVKDPRCAVKESCLFMRINHYGYSPEEAITKPNKRLKPAV